MLFKNSRLTAIVEYLLSHDTYIAPSGLLRHFQISERTLRSDIRDINTVLLKYEAEIVLKRSVGYRLQFYHPENRTVLEQLITERDEYEYLDSADRRINHLIIKMLYSDYYWSQDNIADEVYVSLNTVFNYIKRIRKLLSCYDLKLSTKANLGYIITGSEENKRSCLFDMMTADSQRYSLQFTKEQKTFLPNVNLDIVKELVVKFNNQRELYFSDYSLSSLILHISIFISRLLADQHIENVKPFSHDPLLEEVLTPLINKIETAFSIHWEAYEQNYLLAYYASNKKVLLQNTNDAAYVQKLVECILCNVNTIYQIDLTNDTTLKNDLNIQLHSILSAKCYHLPKHNPLLETIKKNYILAYEVTQTSVFRAFEDSETILTDDDIGYIALHIGAAIERYSNSKHQYRKKVIVAYGISDAEGSFLATKLTSHFGDKIEITGRYPSNKLHFALCDSADLIVSTVSVKTKSSTPVVIVQIPFSRKDFERITKIITQNTLHPVDKIQKFFSQRLFTKGTAENRFEIIHRMCTLLEQEGIVDDTFEMSVFQREQKLSTAMDGIIAMPHPMTLCASRTRIAVGILEHPVKWSDKQSAQIVLMLAITDVNEPDIKLFYDTITSVANNSSLEKLLIQSSCLDEFLQCLKTYIPIDSY